ncbi:MAG: hypothetical protein AAGD09_00120 [Cyanobacteria bacterium P01_F01_bin.56]
MLDSFFDNAGEIVASAASNPLGVAALVILLSGAIAFWWFRHSDEWIRLSIIVMLFAGGLLFAFASGIETSTVAEPLLLEPKSNPGAVILSLDAQQQLEDHLQKEGMPINSEAKAAVLEEALVTYLEPNDVAQPGSVTSTTRKQLVQASETVDGFKFDLYGCLRTGETGVVECDFAVTNEKEDRLLRVIGSNSPQSQIIDSDGTPYITEKVDFGTESSPYHAEIKLVKNIFVTGKLTFDNVSEEVDLLSLLEIGNYARETTEYFTVQFRDIPVPN